MSRHSLIDDIEKAALDESQPITAALRRCVALAGRNGSEELRAWANRELNGYPDDVPLPSYREVPGVLTYNGIVGRNIITGQSCPSGLIPDFARDDLAKPLPFPQPIAEISSMISGADENSIRFGKTGLTDLVQYINQVTLESDDVYGPHQQVTSLYFRVPVSALHGLIDVVRTKLVELVAEMRESLQPGATVPTSEASDQAVGVVIHGDAQGSTFNIHSPISGSSSSTFEEGAPAGDGWWKNTSASVVGGLIAALLLAGGGFGLARCTSGSDDGEVPTTTIELSNTVP